MTTHDAYYLSWSRPTGRVARRLATTPPELERAPRGTTPRPAWVTRLCELLHLGGPGAPRPHTP